MQAILDFLNDHANSLSPVFWTFVITPLVGWILAKWLPKLGDAAIAWFDSHVASTDAQAAFARLVYLAEVVVRRHLQEFVADLKEAAADGKITEPEFAAAMVKQKAEVLAELKGLLGAKGLEELAADLGINAGMIEQFLGWAIEAVLHKVKAGGAAGIVTNVVASAAAPAVEAAASATAETSASPR